MNRNLKIRYKMAGREDPTLTLLLRKEKKADKEYQVIKRILFQLYLH